MDSEIKVWLKTCDIINEIAETEDLHHEELTDTIKNIALQRSGTEELSLKYIGQKGWRKQYQYILFLKSTSEGDVLRLVNLDWLDELIDWLAEQNNNKNYPTLETGKEIDNVSCDNALTYQVSEDGAESIYSLQLYFDVTKDETATTASV